MRFLRFRQWIAATLIALPLAGCDALPKGPDRTLAAIETRGDIRIGITAPLPPEALRLLDRLQKRTHAIPRVETGELEPLLARLDEGGVDLVFAPFRKGTLLEAAAALSPSYRDLRSGRKGDRMACRDEEWREPLDQPRRGERTRR